MSRFALPLIAILAVTVAMAALHAKPELMAATVALGCLTFIVEQKTRGRD